MGYVVDDTDCDDTDPTVYPGALWYADVDGDGFGDPTVTQAACLQPTGFVADMTDCDDGDDEAFPGQTWYADLDGDGFGDPASTPLTQCLPPSGYAVSPTDCDDNATTGALSAPGLTEVCGDGLDNDCLNGVDDGCGPDVTDPVVQILSVTPTPGSIGTP